MPTTYITTQGDVWDLISYKVYGDEGFINTLIAANPAYRGLVVMPAGINLIIPDLPEPSPVTSLPPWKRS